MNENTKVTLTLGQLKKLVRESVVNEHWNMVSKNLETGKLKCHGEYPSRKCGLQYAPEILDLRLKEDAGCDDIDLRDDLIGDFMEAQGKKSVRFGNYVYFLAKNVFNAYGDVKNDPIVPEPVDDSVEVSESEDGDWEYCVLVNNQYARKYKSAFYSGEKEPARGDVSARQMHGGNVDGLWMGDCRFKTRKDAVACMAFLKRTHRNYTRPEDFMVVDRAFWEKFGIKDREIENALWDADSRY